MFNWTRLGRQGHALFVDCRSLDYEVIPLHAEGHVFMVADSQRSRELAASEYNVRRAQCEQAVAALREGLPEIKALRDVTPEPFLRKFAHHHWHRLDAAAMRRASRCLVGRHDFHSFETEWPNRMSSVRTVTHLAVNRVGEYVWIDVEADGFLYNMVRAIAGTLMNVGRGYWPEEKVAEILNAEDRREAGPTAPPQGLFLMRVTY